MPTERTILWGISQPRYAVVTGGLSAEPREGTPIVKMFHKNFAIYNYCKDYDITILIYRFHTKD